MSGGAITVRDTLAHEFTPTPMQPQSPANKSSTATDLARGFSRSVARFIATAERGVHAASPHEHPQASTDLAAHSKPARRAIWDNSGLFQAQTLARRIPGWTPSSSWRLDHSVKPLPRRRRIRIGKNKSVRAGQYRPHHHPVRPARQVRRCLNYIRVIGRAQNRKLKLPVR